jgi:hypothetical protein
MFFSQSLFGEQNMENKNKGPGEKPTGCWTRFENKVTLL